MSTTNDRFAETAGDPLVIEWHVQRHVMFTWEIDIGAVEPLLPPELTAVELRPGIGLFTIAALLYEPGQFRPGSPTFLELVSTIHVQPDLSLKMPVPRYAMHAISVYSDSPDFIEQEGQKLFTPTTFDPSLRFTFGDANDTLEAADGDGPIVSLRSTNPNPQFSHDELWGQHYNDTHGLHFGIWEWDGIKSEYMGRGNAGQFYAHPFYKGMNINKIRRCYIQMHGKPGSMGIERFYRMRKMR